MRKLSVTRRNSKKNSLIKKPRGTRRILGKTPSKKKPPTIKKGRSKNIRTRKVLKGGSSEGQSRPNDNQSVATTHESSFMSGCDRCIVCYTKFSHYILWLYNYSHLVAFFH